MPGLDPGIHVVPSVLNDVDGRDKPGHDDVETDERTNPIVICDSPERKPLSSRRTSASPTGGPLCQPASFTVR